MSRKVASSAKQKDLQQPDLTFSKKTAQSVTLSKQTKIQSRSSQESAKTPVECVDDYEAEKATSKNIKTTEKRKDQQPLALIPKSSTQQRSSQGNIGTVSTELMDDYESSKVARKPRSTLTDEETQAVADLERWNPSSSDLPDSP